MVVAETLDRSQSVEGPGGTPREHKPIPDPLFNLMLGLPAETGLQGLKVSGDSRFRGRGAWYEPFMPDAAAAPELVQVAAGEAVLHDQVALDEGAIPYLVGIDRAPDLAHQLVPDTDEAAAAEAEVEDRINKWLLDVSLMDVMELLDPDDLLDPDQELLASCADVANQMSNDYDGLKDFPDTYLKSLYARELMYVSFGLAKMRELIARYEATGVKVTEFNVLFDFDRSQVAYIDPVRKAIGKNEHGHIIVPESEAYHLVRPGWGYLVRHMRKELGKDVELKVGAATDRPQNDPHGNKGKALVAYAREHFTAAGIPEDLIDDELIVSSTDSPLVEQLPKFLRYPMRKLIKRAADGSPIPMTERQVALHKGRQRMALVKAGLASKKMVYSDRFIYHEKLSIGIGLRNLLRGRPGAVAMILDDLRVIKYLQAENVMGAQIEPALQPLVPDEMKPEEMVDMENAVEV